MPSGNHRALVSLTSFGAFESDRSSSGHFRSDNEVGWGGGGQIGRRTSLAYFSAVHAMLGLVPASFIGASEFLLRRVRAAAWPRSRCTHAARTLRFPGISR
jgi:hypothetical protein